MRLACGSNSCRSFVLKITRSHAPWRQHAPLAVEIHHVTQGRSNGLFHEPRIDILLACGQPPGLRSLPHVVRLYRLEGRLSGPRPAREGSSDTILKFRLKLGGLGKEDLAGWLTILGFLRSGSVQ